MLAGLWNVAAPILGNIGRTVASAFLTDGIKRVSSSLADKGISIDKRALQGLKNDVYSGQKKRRKMQQQYLRTMYKKNDDPKVYQQQVLLQQQDDQQPQVVVKKRIINKPKKPALRTGKSKFLRKR